MALCLHQPGFIFPSPELNTTGKERGEESFKNFCHFSMVGDINSSLQQCVFLLFLSVVYVPEKSFLVVFDISGQFQFKLRFCLSNCISVHSGNAFLVLNRCSTEGLSSGLHLGGQLRNISHCSGSPGLFPSSEGVTIVILDLTHRILNFVSHSGKN